MKVNNVLLVGNGFDLAHGLLTKYEHFLYIMKKWDEFYVAYENERKKDNRKEKNTDEQAIYQFFPELIKEFEKAMEKPIDKYVKYAHGMDRNNINKLGSIIKTNSWIKYYCQCEAEINGWIDFEREIYPVIELLEFVFEADYIMIGHGNSTLGDAHIDKSIFPPSLLRTARLWGKYFDTSISNSVCVKEPYATMQYGILKKKILEDLRKEFDEFIQAFELYLYEFVYKRDDVDILKQIKDIDITTVISFNYTLTEKLYGINEEDVHHIHGMLRNDLSIGKNNMVMGVKEQKEQNMAYIYFVKYFQRIQKASGIKYKELITRKTIDNNVMHSDYILHIYGHSLDETDEDILKYVIGDKMESGKMNLKPKKVVIFYYNDVDYEQKVINLIKLYGRQMVEEYMEKGLFEFVEIIREKVG